MSIAWKSDVAPSELFCSRFSIDDVYVAASYANGAIKIFDAKTGKEEFALNDDKKENQDQDTSPNRLSGLEFPTTQLRWRPHNSQSKTENVLISVNAETDGLVQHWHVKSGKLLHSIKEDGNPIFCIDYAKDGSIFCTAGRDRTLRVYDEATKKRKCLLSDGDLLTTAGHSNRVFSLKFSDNNTIVSGGWDSTVQIWDLRKGYSVRSIFGCHICGDSVDVSNDGRQILTGSYRTEDCLQLWDVSTGKLIESVPWRTAGHISGASCMIFSAEFSKDENNSLIAACGTQENEVKIFDRNSKILTSMQSPRALFSIDFSHDSKHISVGGADGVLTVLNVEH